MQYEFPIKFKQYAQVKEYFMGNKPIGIFTLDVDKYRDTSVGVVLHGSVDGFVSDNYHSFECSLEELGKALISKYSLVEKGIKEIMVLCCHGAYQEEAYIDGIHIYPMLRTQCEINCTVFLTLDDECLLVVQHEDEEVLQCIS